MEIITSLMNNYALDKDKKKRIVLLNYPCSDVSFVRLSLNCPHYFITKNGACYQFYDKDVLLNTMVYNDNNIYVGFENMSMLTYFSGDFYNIFEKKYKTEYIEKPWKGYQYWDAYSDNQYLALNQLLPIFNIKGRIKNTLEYDSDIVKFEGICSRANFSSLFYDVTPAFNFKHIYY